MYLIINEFKDGYVTIGYEGDFKTFLASTLSQKRKDEIIESIILDEAIKYFTNNPKESFNCYECYHCNCWEKTLNKFRKKFVKICKRKNLPLDMAGRG